jgi:endonuclease YncB( thermonuclease family)
VNKILCCALVFLFLFLLVAPHAVYAYPGEMNGTVTQIVDGDTFYFVALNGTKYTIRMADVNASEIGQTGYVEAKAALDSMIYGKTVYLDVDDLYIWDNRGTGSRVVAIPYIDHNSTHFLNVNEAMFQGGYVEKKDYRNEFNPYTWRLYEPKAQGIPEFPIVTALIVLLAAGAIVGIVLKRRLVARQFGFFTG